MILNAFFYAHYYIFSMNRRQEKAAAPRQFIDFIEEIIKSQNESNNFKELLCSCESKLDLLFNLISKRYKEYVTLTEICQFCQIDEEGVVRKYFKIQQEERMTITSFKTKFLSSSIVSLGIPQRSPLKLEEVSNIFKDYVSFVVESYYKFEEMRRQIISSRQVDQIKDWFAKEYQISRDVLDKMTLKEFMFDNALYSRAKFALASNYIIGDKNEIKWDCLFGPVTLSQRTTHSSIPINSPPTTSTVKTMEDSQEPKLDIKCSIKVVGRVEQDQQDEEDIMAKIDTIEEVLKQKKKSYIEKMKNLHDSSKPAVRQSYKAQKMIPITEILVDLENQKKYGNQKSKSKKAGHIKICKKDTSEGEVMQKMKVQAQKQRKQNIYILSKEQDDVQKYIEKLLERRKQRNSSMATNEMYSKKPSPETRIRMKEIQLEVNARKKDYKKMLEQKSCQKYRIPELSVYEEVKLANNFSRLYSQSKRIGQIPTKSYNISPRSNYVFNDYTKYTPKYYGNTISALRRLF